MVFPSHGDLLWNPQAIFTELTGRTFIIHSQFVIAETLTHIRIEIDLISQAISTSSIGLINRLEIVLTLDPSPQPSPQSWGRGQE
jgi:hypothetical protein